MSLPDSPFSPPNSRSLVNDLDQALENVSEDALLDTAFLVGLSGKHAGKLFRIKTGDNIIGRSSRAFLTLDQKSVSHQHARLHLSAQGCFVTDLQSTNGTFVNDTKVSAPVCLKAGDVVRIGTSTLGFLTDAEDDEQHTRALARVTGTQTSMSPAPVQPGEAAIVVAPGTAHLADVSATAIEEGTVSGLDNALDKIALGFAFLKSYWKLLVLCGALLGAAAGATVAFFPPKAVAEFEIFLRRDQTRNPTQHFATRGVDFFITAEKNFNKLEIVKKTMENMGMSTGGNAVVGTARGLTFGAVSRTNYRGSYAHTDASFAEKFLAEHVKNYLEHEIGKSISVLKSEVDLLEEQYTENKDKLQKQEAQLRDFKLDHLDALPDQAEGQLSSRVGLMTRRDTLAADLERFTQELALSRKQLKSEDALVQQKVAQSAPYERELAEVRKRLAATRAQGFAAGHPDVIKLKDQESELLKLQRKTIRSASTDTDRRSNMEHKRLQNRVGELEVAVAATGKELGLVQTRLGEITKIAGDLPKVEADYAELTRQVNSSQKLHSRLYEQLKAKQLELEFERASVAARYEVLEPPSAWPVQPVRTAAFRAAVGTVAGVIGGLFLAALHWLVMYARSRREELGA